MAEEPKEPGKGEAPAGSMPRLLEILVCPRTKTSLVYDEARQELISRAARLAYPDSRRHSRSCWRRRRARSTTRSCAPWAGADTALRAGCGVSRRPRMACGLRAFQVLPNFDIAAC